MAAHKSKVDRAMAIVRRLSGRRSSAVHAAVRAAGISTRTYRTARKTMHAQAIRKSYRGRARGRGRWHVRAK